VIPQTDKPNQDRAIAVSPIGEKKGMALFGVFDGHGPYGHLCSAFVASYLPKFFAKSLEEGKSVEEAGLAAFKSATDLLFKSPIDLNFSGTTACCSVLDGKKLYTFNVGDSRAILGRRIPDTSDFEFVALSRDHKPTLSEEKARIEKAGGRVEPLIRFGKAVGDARVWLKDQHVPGLSVSRSIGDSIAATIGVIAVPEIQVRELKEGDDAFIILASDGVWEFISSEDIVQWVCEEPNPNVSCQILVEEATLRWQEEDPEGSRDDITLAVAFFPSHKPRPRKEAEAEAEDVPEG
jgi:serine/threonine protein phosphatase PrpC